MRANGHTNVLKLHGVPQQIVNDHDVKFMISFWRTFFEIMETTLTPSTTYHLKTDGQMERVNNNWVETYLRYYCHDTQGVSDDWLPLAKFAYNRTYHYSIGMSPYGAVYGYKVNMPMMVEK